MYKVRKMKYDVILADPPWHFKTYGKSDANLPQSHYDTIESKDDMVALMHKTVTAVAAENCALFMWAVDWNEPKFSQLAGEAEGFTYRTRAFLWVKKTKTFKNFVGRGYYTQSNPEDVWLFVKGNMPVQDRGVRKLLEAQMGVHSQKPMAIHKNIERLYPNMNYLELFARTKREGWDVWGNEVESDVEITHD